MANTASNKIVRKTPTVKLWTPYAHMGTYISQNGEEHGDFFELMVSVILVLVVWSIEPSLVLEHLLLKNGM